MQHARHRRAQIMRQKLNAIRLKSKHDPLEIGKTPSKSKTSNKEGLQLKHKGYWTIIEQANFHIGAELSCCHTIMVLLSLFNKALING